MDQTPERPMPASAQKERLKEKDVAKALKSFDWPWFERRLSSFDFDTDALSELLGHIRRSGDFVIRRPNAGRDAARAAFVDGLAVFLGERLGAGAFESLHAEIDLTRRIESGYHEILRTQEATVAAKLLPEVQASAALSRAAHTYDQLANELLSSGRRRSQLTLQSFRIKRPDGSSFSPDSVLSALVDIATRTMLLLGYGHGWFDAEQFLVLPELTKATDDEIFKAGLTDVLAASWRHWENIDQRCRHFGGELATFAGTDLPDWAPAGAERAVQYDWISEAELFDHFANHRLNDRMVQTFQEMLLKTGAQSRASGIAGPLDLPPGAFVSAEEAHADVSLSEILGYQIVDDLERPGGLRLVEWVRGYATLRQFMEDRYARGGRDGLCVTVSRDDLVAVLDRVGLKDGAAQTFVDNVSLRASSRDLFDHPAIRLENGSLLLFGPGILDTDPARATLSSIGHRREPLERKGEAFESEMLRFLQKQGFGAQTLKFKVGGEEYQYDALVPWGDHVFVVECKNKTLSGFNASSAYYFALEMTSAIKQVRRLAEGLQIHADTVLKRVGIDVTGKTIVPCVVNSLPYAMSGSREGVFVTDASGLQRFFQEPYLHINRPHALKRKAATVLHRIAVKKLWEGERPTPADLLRYLEDPPQLQLARAHVEVGRHGFALGNRSFAAVSHLVYKEMTDASVSKAFGADGRSVRRDGRMFTRAVRAAERQEEVRTIRDADRAWRAKQRRKPTEFAR
ncbi:nuclease-related domain-containing protein [Methylobacterium sp. J-090]|uniref:nuclease-related domain-containing protein n=1 Tax=Methylobacterium sp. J-090 TaxID=2836666 RepID=UPI001FB9AD7B|nr:nuclease-related domain-containing protein [Methylobacterium sp. J-090]MCJ2079894.1 NERD domain-containing protein [Methylobacterium sp. J-090]